MTIYLRHRTRDVYIFQEVFGIGSGRHQLRAAPAGGCALDAKAAPAVLDIGGNIGLFGAYTLGRWPGATIRSFEPDPTNLPIIRRVISGNGLQHSWTVVPVAVANERGATCRSCPVSSRSPNWPGSRRPTRHPKAAVLDDGETISVHAVDLFDQDHDVDLLKMDIEGGEWSILTDPRLGTLKADAIVLEWHATGCPVADPRTAAIELLDAASYVHIEETEDFGYRGLLWAWRGEDGG